MDTPQLFPPSLEVTPNIMYELGSIKSELRAIRDKLESKERDQDEELKSLKSKVNDLESSRKWQLGFAAGISAVIGFVFSLLRLPWQNLIS